MCGEDATTVGLLKCNNELVGKLCNAVAKDNIAKLTDGYDENDTQILYEAAAGPGGQENGRGYRCEIGRGQ
jgi:hypothetical protein